MVVVLGLRVLGVGGLFVFMLRCAFMRYYNVGGLVLDCWFCIGLIWVFGFGASCLFVFANGFVVLFVLVWWVLIAVGCLGGLGLVCFLSCGVLVLFFVKCGLGWFWI